MTEFYIQQQTARSPYGNCAVCLLSGKHGPLLALTRDLHHLRSSLKVVASTVLEIPTLVDILSVLDHSTSTKPSIGMGDSDASGCA